MPSMRVSCCSLPKVLYVYFVRLKPPCHILMQYPDMKVAADPSFEGFPGDPK